MKTILIIITLISILLSCSIELTYDWQIPENIRTIEKALSYVSTINYVPKYGCFTPEELYYWGYGDCEDFTLMLQYLFESQLGLNADFIIGKFNNSSYYHAWIESNGNIYDATGGIKISEEQKYMYKGEYRYTYPGSIRIVQKYGGFITDPAYLY